MANVAGDDGFNILKGTRRGDRFDGRGGFDYVNYEFSPAVVASLLNPRSNKGDAKGDTYTAIEGLIGSASDDRLEGDGFNNWLVGGTGGDALNGQGGFDYAAYWNASSGVTASLSDPAQNQGDDAEGDTYEGIEALAGSSFNDHLIGDDFGNTLIGDEGADTLDGRGGFDYASYFHNDEVSGVKANLANAKLNSGEAKGDVYIGIEGLMGTRFADTLTGDDGSNWLRGQGGGDRLVGGGGSDNASYWLASDSVVASLSKPSTNKGDAKGDTYVSIENLYGSGFADKLTGDSRANNLGGGWGNDTLSGGAGRDTFTFDTAPDGGANVETILDFKPADDAILLEDFVFSGLSAAGSPLDPEMFRKGRGLDAAQDGDDRILYDTGSGRLYFDADGTGQSASAIHFATIQNKASLAAADFLVI